MHERMQEMMTVVFFLSKFRVYGKIWYGILCLESFLIRKTRVGLISRNAFHVY